MNKDKGNEPLLWVPNTDKEVLDKMFQYKLDRSYERPSHLDILTQQAIVISKRSTCLFYEVGAVIFSDDIMLSSGYNGAARGDVAPRVAGCARIVDGKIQAGQGLCRGSHAELNAIGNLTSGTVGLDDLQMVVTLHPCFSCAKQIVNKKIKKVYYVWEYGREKEVTQYLIDRGVVVEKYTSVFLQRWIERNGYDPVGLRHQKP